MLWENFDLNEVVVFSLSLCSYVLIFLLPKKFSKRVTMLSVFFGLATGMLFDFTIGGGLLNYYVLNDSDVYELTDMIYYSIFGPFSFLFFYFYEVLHINKKSILPYIISWVVIGILFQWIFNKIGVVTIQNGYKLLYSFAIFLVVQSVSAIYYEVLRKKEKIFVT
ncbi:hypothetical protein [Bacillus sp. B1-b2]|uniref:hypothetical protein n=1 Tax=Bacillus sp. B1-b2 TaxID=2653201 RepID=UPI001261798D|nr:hypothetical protein [Bacillus sp. B1-b2]KAB7671251.1 hypothetical protein F9279_06995 [Bacillus sp. B1-b2]